MKSTRLLRWLAVAAFTLCFVVVVLGAYVRLSAAGLGCPDWPGCYGHFTPEGALRNAEQASARFGGQEIEAGKAWKEMIHRYAAASLGFLIVLITALAIRHRRDRVLSVRYAAGLLCLVVAQGVLGMLTVTWQLKPLIVTAHLLFGFTTLAMLWWLVLTLWRRSDAWQSAGGFTPQGWSGARQLATVALLVLTLQILLGGWTSSNYAATACPDFPKCQDAWLPATDFADAFIPWRGLGINYEGGVLEHPARVAVHLSHRVGAVVTALVLLFATISIQRLRRERPVRNAAAAVQMLLLLQVLIGMFTVLRGFPLWLATAHNAGAALLLLAMVALHRSLRPP